jgi:hypothetical protein
MLKIGKLTFGTKGELLYSLFNPTEGRTLDGIYKKRKNGIALNRPDGEPWMFLVANRWGERFFVSATRLDNGKTVYSYGLSTADENSIGLEFAEQLQCASDTWETICAREARGAL